MSPSSYIQRVDELAPLFKTLDTIIPVPPSERERIRPMLRTTRLSRGAYFVRAGEVSDLIGYMCAGLLRYFYTDENGNEFTRYFCRGGSFVSTADAARTPSLYAVQALEDTKMILVSYRNWSTLVDSHPVWGRITVAVQEHALRLAEERERSLILDNATRRYRALLDEYPNIESTVKQYDIASYLGITPVALSRIRGRKN